MLKSYGWWWWGGWPMAHVILVSAQVLDFGIGTLDFGLGLDNIILDFRFKQHVTNM